MLGRIRINNERTVESFVQMPLKRSRVAVIQMATKGFGIKFINYFLVWKGFECTRNAVLTSRVDTVKVQV